MFSQKDVYVLGVTLAAAWIMWRVVDVVTLGAGLALIGSATLSGYAFIALLVGASFCVFSIFASAYMYVRGVLGAKDGKDGMTTLDAAPLYLLLLVGLHVGLLVLQSLWYLQNGY